jgi:hypothetical protein
MSAQGTLSGGQEATYSENSRRAEHVVELWPTKNLVTKRFKKSGRPYRKMLVVERR